MIAKACRDTAKKTEALMHKEQCRGGYEVLPATYHRVCFERPIPSIQRFLSQAKKEKRSWKGVKTVSDESSLVLFVHFWDMMQSQVAGRAHIMTRKKELRPRSKEYVRVFKRWQSLQRRRDWLPQLLWQAAPLVLQEDPVPLEEITDEAIWTEEMRKAKMPVCKKNTWIDLKITI